MLSASDLSEFAERLAVGDLFSPGEVPGQRAYRLGRDKITFNCLDAVVIVRAMEDLSYVAHSDTSVYGADVANVIQIENDPTDIRRLLVTRGVKRAIQPLIIIVTLPPHGVIEFGDDFSGGVIFDGKFLEKEPVLGQNILTAWINLAS